MDTTSVAYVLCRIEDDSSLTPVSQHGDIFTGIAAGGYAVEVEDFDYAYALYAGLLTRVPNRTRNQTEHLPPEHLALLMHRVNQGAELSRLLCA